MEYIINYRIKLNILMQKKAFFEKEVKKYLQPNNFLILILNRQSKPKQMNYVFLDGEINPFLSRINMHTQFSNFHFNVKQQMHVKKSFHNISFCVAILSI